MASIGLFLPTALNFSGDDYDFWATKMQRFLIVSDLWDTVDKGFQAPIVDTQLTEVQQKMSKENSSKDVKALFILQSTVSDKIFPSIKNATTAKQAWDILRENQSINKKWMESMRAMQYHSGEKSNISNKSAVPEKLRKENEDSYKPKVVSIGPRFRGSTRDLLKMEETKWTYVSRFLDRLENAESNLAKCGELLEQEKEVLESYVDDPKLMKWRDMANIVLYDACFVLELLNGGLFYFYFTSCLPAEDWKKVLSDMLVLDNQIPFFILRELYCQLFGETDDSIETPALNFFGYKIRDRSLLSADTKNASNLVELVHSYISKDLKDGIGQESNQLILKIREDIKQTPVQLRRCATMLRVAGVKINLLNSDDIELPFAFDFRIRFNSSSGTLDIPRLFIDEMSKAWWLNLIAWEHHKMETSETIICKCTSAAMFFNALICCESDVQLLQDMGVIEVKYDMSNKDLVTFFRSIIHGINHRYNIFSFDALNKYHRSPINYGTEIPLRLWHYLTGSPREALRDLHNFLKRGYNYAAALITILSLLQTISSSQEVILVRCFSLFFSVEC